MNIPSETLNISLQEINNIVANECGDILIKYHKNYQDMRKRHSVFSHLWSSPFTHDHRCMNRIMYYLITREIIPLKENEIVFDCGCYDGMLIACLNHAGFETYGYEKHHWTEMYRSLDIDDKVNSCPYNQRVGIFIMLNYVHEFHPDGLMQHIHDFCFGSVPRICIFDREERTPHPNNKLYYSKQYMDKLNLSVVRFPEIFKMNIETRREFIVKE